MTIAPSGALRASKVSNLNGNRVKRVAIELNNSTNDIGHQAVCPRLPLDAALGVKENANVDITTARNDHLVNQVISGEASMTLSPDLIGSLRTLEGGRLGQFSSTSQLGPAAQALSQHGISLQSITVDSPQIIQQDSQRVRTPRTTRLLMQRQSHKDGASSPHMSIKPTERRLHITLPSSTEPVLAGGDGQATAGGNVAPDLGSMKE